MQLPARITVVEVGPRDGLQNEAAPVPTATKVNFIDALSRSGLAVIEATSFVSPRWVPQMADAADVFRHIDKRPGVRYPVLVPNEHGMTAALDAGVEEIALFTAASDTFNRRNINTDMAGALKRLGRVAEMARQRDIRIRGYVSCALGCPYEGNVEPAAVARVAADLRDLGCYEVSLGDTIGVGTPLAARRMLATVADRVGMERLAVHFHDTRGQALANVLACLQEGVTVVDAAVAGLGGCPYADGASGNVATEDLIYMLHGMGIETGIDLDALLAAGRYICEAMGRTPSSRLGRLQRGRLEPRYST